MTWPLISVVTPTWHRHGLLLNRCIPSVAAQDYDGPVEHIIVSGPDPELLGLLAGQNVRYIELEENVADGGATPRRIGASLARGDLIAYLDDDVSYRPAHLSKLAEAMTGGADFAFSVMQTWRGDTPAHFVGSPPPQYGAIDTSLIINRPELLDVATWEKVYGWVDGRPPDPDGDLVQRWMAAGATWAFTGAVTVDYWFDEPGGSRA